MKLNVLLVCNKPNVGADANTIVDHLESIQNYSVHHIWTHSAVGDLFAKVDLNQFDVVVIHYSICIFNEHYISKSSKQKLRDYTGLKVIFIQDEYRQINAMVDTLSFLKVDVIFTCFPAHEFEHIYPKARLPSVSIYNNLTGYIPVRLTEISNQPLIAERSIDVGYRGRRLGYWYGELAYEKWNIVEKWKENVHTQDLVCNVSYYEKDRLYGQAWIDFLSACKTTLGVESGTSVMDFTGELEKTVDAYQMRHPKASFHEVQEKFLLPYEGKHQLNQISPRCFEAIALKTVLVLYEGEYSGILIPGRHYIALKKDFSNIDAVLAFIGDHDFLQEMADRTFVEIAQNPIYGYPAYLQWVDGIISSEFLARKKGRPVLRYTKESFERDRGVLSLKSKLMAYLFRVYQGLPYSTRQWVRAVVRPLR